jgi:hypothetical protein
VLWRGFSILVVRLCRSNLCGARSLSRTKCERFLVHRHQASGYSYVRRGRRGHASMMPSGPRSSYPRPLPVSATSPPSSGCCQGPGSTARAKLETGVFLPGRCALVMMLERMAHQGSIVVFPRRTCRRCLLHSTESIAPSNLGIKHHGKRRPALKNGGNTQKLRRGNFRG